MSFSLPMSHCLPDVYLLDAQEMPSCYRIYDVFIYKKRNTERGFNLLNLTEVTKESGLVSKNRK